MTNNTLSPRAFFVLFVSSWLILLMATLASAATKTWTGNALSVPQIQTITIAGTWATTETHTVTINGKAIVVTLAANVTTANVATAIKEAWMSTTRLDGSASTDATSNAGGNSFGEFAEVSATVSGSVVTLTGVTPGKPFTVTVSETAASGTSTLATPQACTGSHHWDNAKNWDTGTVPANDDIVVFRDSDVSCLYGLPNGSLEVTIQQYQTFTGQIGLPTINRDDSARPYYEYRQRYVRLDDAGTGTNIGHQFGVGKDGAGSPLINLKQLTVKSSPIVYNTGAPRILGTKALNICCTANTSTLNILNGSVDFSSQDGGSSAFLAVSQSTGDSRGINGLTGTAEILMSGGYMLVGGASANGSYTVKLGTLRFEGQTGIIDNIRTYDTAVVDYASIATVSNLKMYGGTFDARGDAGAFTLTGAQLYLPSRFYDPYRRITYTNPISLAYNPNPDILLGVSNDDLVEINPNP